jgi:hypothetical protein
MDFGHDGKLLVCDATGTYLVDNRCRLPPSFWPALVGSCSLLSCDECSSRSYHAQGISNLYGQP